MSASTISPGHGVPQSLIDAQYAEAARFHAQPMDAKLAIKVNEHTIGYMPIAETAPPNAAAQGKKPSQNEAFFLRRERTRRRSRRARWPSLPCAEPVAGRTCRASASRRCKYMTTLEALCRKLVPLYALALDLPANWFDACFAKPHMILRQSRYPVIDGADDTIASLVPHTDSGFMTLLPPNKVQGLSILPPNGRWLDAPYVEGAFVVNGGDILHRWTNERFLSTPHRVRNVSGTVRYAIPFFCDPDHDTVIECLPSCRSATTPAKYPPIKFADYAVWFSAQRYQHMQNVAVPSEAEVAPGARATERWKS